MIFPLVVVSALALGVPATLAVSRPLKNLTWTPCETAPSPFECTTFQVPLDWGDRSKGLVPLSVIRLPASVQPRQGYMFYNPGGPGAPGTTSLAQYGKEMQRQLGDGWDVVSWDPRGVLKSGPNISMFSSDEEYFGFWGQLQGKDKVQAHGNLTTPSDVDFFMSQVPAADAMAQSLNTMMIQKNGDNLKYVGSCAVTRDLVALVDAIYGHGADVNFWGSSYGTLLATYLTQMFPERVGRVIIDGVFEPYAYSNKSPMDWLDIDLASAEQGLVKWTELCVANGDQCKLAAMGNNTAQGVHKLLEDLLDTAHRSYDGTVWDPVLDLFNVTIASNPRKWTFSTIAGILHSSLYSSEAGRINSELLASVVEEVNSVNNSTTRRRREANALMPPISLKRVIPYASLAAVEENTYPPYVLSMLTLAIFCGDAVDSRGQTTKDFFQKVVKASQTVSPKFAPLTADGNMRGFCHRWKPRAVERLPKKINIKPKNVVLVIGNSEDPVTPYSSAKLLASSAHLGNKARLVKYNVMGHTITAAPSTCIDEIIRKFVNGQPPRDGRNDEADVECSPDRQLWDFPIPSS
ncbi:alpha/beta-hydrolase [Serendipita vermifera]|nr:alpha/beta-hydrolase [Serendipita vermifera]PVF96912.1 alpha/beta-hydrolase [Serendipita vermifera]